MSTDKGYIKVYRDIRDHWLWDDKPFSRGQAWIDLIMLMNHKDEKFMFSGRLTDVKRGSRITSLRQLAERWGWSKEKVSVFLDILEAEGMINQIRDSKKTVITLIKYGVYQGLDKNLRQRKDTDRTLNGNKSNAHRNKQDIKEDTQEDIKKKKAPPPDDDDFIPDLRKACEEDDDDDW